MKPISENQKKYLEEYERLKHIIILPGIYSKKNADNFKYEILSIDPVSDTAILNRVGGNLPQTKTLHWCRKNLVRVEESQ